MYIYMKQKNNRSMQLLEFLSNHACLMTNSTQMNQLCCAEGFPTMLTASLGWPVLAGLVITLANQSDYKTSFTQNQSTHTHSNLQPHGFSLSAILCLSALWNLGGVFEFLNFQKYWVPLWKLLNQQENMECRDNGDKNRAQSYCFESKQILSVSNFV